MTSLYSLFLLAFSLGLCQMYFMVKKKNLLHPLRFNSTNRIISACRQALPPKNVCTTSSVMCIKRIYATKSLLLLKVHLLLYCSNCGLSNCGNSVSKWSLYNTELKDTLRRWTECHMLFLYSPLYQVRYHKNKHRPGQHARSRAAPAITEGCSISL